MACEKLFRNPVSNTKIIYNHVEIHGSWLVKKKTHNQTRIGIGTMIVEIFLITYQVILTINRLPSNITSVTINFDN